MLRLLLLSLLAALPLGAAAQNVPFSPIEGPTDNTLVAAYVPSDSSPTVAGRTSAASDRMQLGTPDDVCYRIRAYIFRRDDDHAPKLIRSTTCGPQQPRTQNAMAPEAHFSPLK